VLELKGLTRRYGDLVALDNLSFTVRERQMFGFVGPNGAGKTTAMRIVLGVLEPDAGEVRWRGRPMNHEMRQRIGYLPEDHGQTFSSLFARIPGAQQRRILSQLSSRRITGLSKVRPAATTQFRCLPRLSERHVPGAGRCVVAAREVGVGGPTGTLRLPGFATSLAL
jgi:ABC-type branched-subunit amino acid transport system ATPase component